jgi:hypothetical protein
MYNSRIPINWGCGTVSENIVLLQRIRRQTVFIITFAGLYDKVRTTDAVLVATGLNTDRCKIV